MYISVIILNGWQWSAHQTWSRVIESRASSRVIWRPSRVGKPVESFEVFILSGYIHIGEYSLGLWKRQLCCCCGNCGKSQVKWPGQLTKGEVLHQATAPAHESVHVAMVGKSGNIRQVIITSSKPRSSTLQKQISVLEHFPDEATPHTPFVGVLGRCNLIFFFFFFTRVTHQSCLLH